MVINYKLIIDLLNNYNVINNNVIVFIILLFCTVEIYEQFYWSFTYGFCEDSCNQFFWHCCKWKFWWIHKTVQFAKACWNWNVAAPWR